jgi:hypothetical protein
MGTDLDDCSGGLERILLARSALAHRKTPGQPTPYRCGIAYPRTRVSSAISERIVGWSCARPRSRDTQFSAPTRPARLAHAPGREVLTRGGRMAPNSSSATAMVASTVAVEKERRLRAPRNWGSTFRTTTTA